MEINMRNCTNTQLLRKMLIVLLLCSFIAGTFTASSDKKQSDGKTPFTVGFDAEFPPYVTKMRVENMLDLTYL